jgi:hypothetical protein
MRLVLGDDFVETPLVERSFASDCDVEPRRVLALQELHPGADVRLRRLDDEMEVFRIRQYAWQIHRYRATV